MLSTIKGLNGGLGSYGALEARLRARFMGFPENFNFWGECVAQDVALYKGFARCHASLSVSKRRVGQNDCAFSIYPLRIFDLYPFISRSVFISFYLQFYP